MNRSKFHTIFLSFICLLFIFAVSNIVYGDEADEHYNKGNMFFSAKRYQWAIDEYQIALQLRPDHQKAKTQLDMALSAHSSGISTSSNYQNGESYHYNRGNVFFSIGRYQWAIEEYQRSLEIQPNYIKSQMQLDRAIAILNGATATQDSTIQAVSRVVNNSYVQVASGDAARFTMGTTGGHPNNPNDNNKNLIYLHFHPDTPGVFYGSQTSFTTVRIDGNDYVYGITIGAAGSIVSHGSPTQDAQAGGYTAGGASGGGAIALIYAVAYSNSGTVSTNGGVGGTTADPKWGGGDGGAGTIQTLQVKA